MRTTRPREVAAGITSPFPPDLRMLAGIVTSPGYLRSLILHGQPRFGNLKPYTTDDADVNEVAAFVRREMGGAFTWDEVARYRERWKRPLVVKGISSGRRRKMRVARSRRHRGVEPRRTPGRGPAGSDRRAAGHCRAVGGGDGDARPRRALGARRRARALRWGRHAAFAGKAFLWGLGALGAEGPGHVIDLMIDEMKSAFGQIGAFHPGRRAPPRSAIRARCTSDLRGGIGSSPDLRIRRKPFFTNPPSEHANVGSAETVAYAAAATASPAATRWCGGDAGARRRHNTVLVATAGIVGPMLAPDKGLATLPISFFVLGMWMATLPGRLLARRFGRRNALQVGTACGVLTGLICCLAVLQGSFLLFNVGAVFGGFYAAAHQSYRFAAADTASEAFRPKAFPGFCSAVSSPASSTHSSSPPRSSSALSFRRDLYRPVRARPGLGGCADVPEHTEAAATLGGR